MDFTYNSLEAKGQCPLQGGLQIYTVFLECFIYFVSAIYLVPSSTLTVKIGLSVLYVLYKPTKVLIGILSYEEVNS